MTIVNLERDMHWVYMQSGLQLSGDTTFPAPTLRSSGVVNPKINMAHTQWGATSVSTGFVKTLGVLMEGVFDDSMPYRIKARVHKPEDVPAFLFYGYAPASPTADSTIAGARILGDIGKEGVDELVCITPLAPTENEYGRAIGFGIAFGEASNADLMCSISVARLGSKPPGYATSVS